MRPHEKQRQDFNPQNLFCDVALLVCQARVPDPQRGRTEGPHCPTGGMPPRHPVDHICNTNNIFCEEAARIGKESLELWSSQLPLCIQVMGVPNECSLDDPQCPSGSLLIEKWTCQVHPRRNPDESLLPAQFLLQALRSHLHFSLLSAWLTKAKGKLPFKIHSVTSLHGEEWKGSSGGCYETHQFPMYQIGKSLVLSVSVQSIPRSEEAPSLRCACPESPLLSLPPHQPFLQTSTGDSDVGLLRKPRDTGTQSEFGLEWAPIELPRSSGWTGRVSSVDSSVDNPLFDAAAVRRWSKTTGDHLRARIDALSLSEADKIVENTRESPTRRTSRQNSAEPSSSDKMAADGEVKFYIEDDNSSGLSAEAGQQKGITHKLDEQFKNRQGNSGMGKRKKRLSQKILFSGENEVILSEDDGSDFMKSAMEESVYPPCADRDLPSCSGESGLRKTSFTEGFSDPSSKMGLRNKRAGDKDSQGYPLFAEGKFGHLKKSCVARQLAGGGQFSRRTGLPLSSSPAPLKRNQYSFNYDTSLTSVSNIRSALYDHDSGSSDSESGTSLCKSAPASTNLLGNFENEVRTRPEFTTFLAASGAFCPAHAALNVITFFFNVSDDNAPSPYLGHCSLESVGKKGYHLPRKGTLQATLFNPQGTVVKMFVVRYDMSEMPASCQTFVRQRTFFMPSSASLQDAAKNRSWLRYLIHLRLATSRSGKLYLHTDIRMLFSRKSELDANNLETESGGTISSADAGNYELRSFTEMPKNPKFSPKKLGSHTNSRCEKKNLVT